jgi:uncharacterized Zn finger protein (UPF0148 family)
LKRTATYYKDPYMKESFTVEYDDETPCVSCGEPVVSASMGGTALCPWCDMGKCRYCGMQIMVLKEEIDGGDSKRNLLEHMKWHRERDPDLNSKLLENHRRVEAKLREEKANKASIP